MPDPLKLADEAERTYADHPGDGQDNAWFLLPNLASAIREIHEKLEHQREWSDAHKRAVVEASEIIKGHESEVARLKEENEELHRVFMVSAQRRMDLESEVARLKGELEKLREGLDRKITDLAMFSHHYHDHTGDDQLEAIRRHVEQLAALSPTPEPQKEEE